MIEGKIGLLKIV